MTGRELSIAENEWLESEQGQSLLKTEGFCESRMQQYLKNRITNAFRAGVAVAEKLLDAERKARP